MFLRRCHFIILVPPCTLATRFDSFNLPLITEKENSIFFYIFGFIFLDKNTRVSYLISLGLEENMIAFDLLLMTIKKDPKFYRFFSVS